MKRKVNLLDVESSVRVLYHREDTPIHIKETLGDTMTLINNFAEFMSSVLNIIDNKYYEVKSELYDAKGMDKMVALNDKHLLDSIKEEIDSLDRGF